MRRLTLVLAAACVAASPGVTAQQPFTTLNERCILPASAYYGLNPHLLRAILKVESGLNPAVVNVNKNGTRDVGIGGINSMHFPMLSAYGITPEHLKDACVGTYVSAWHLAKQIAAYGLTWEAVARYHSATPYFNHRYQVLLSNELVRARVIPGRIQPVPPLERSAPKARNTSQGQGATGSVVFDGH